jgi:hypothetical protein
MKKHSTIGCCGIDCGLCPRYHTKGDSVCPGCDGPDFKLKHPSCGFVTCCVSKKELEVCSDCTDYPCKRFDSEKQGYDSFVTHRKVFSNLEFLKNNGINTFIKQQNIRINILNDFLTRFDDNRSKSFFCISCALLPLENLIEIHTFMNGPEASLNSKEKNKLLKEKILITANKLNINLKLNTK